MRYYVEKSGDRRYWQPAAAVKAFGFRAVALRGPDGFPPPLATGAKKLVWDSLSLALWLDRQRPPDLRQFADAGASGGADNA